MLRMTQVVYKALQSWMQVGHRGNRAKKARNIVAFCCALALLGGGARLAVAHDELYYPASMCQPTCPGPCA